MFKKPTLAQIIKRDLADALHNAHDHSKAAEHHDALMMMYTDRAQRLQERLDAMDNPDSRPPAGHFPKVILSALAEDFPAVGARP